MLQITCKKVGMPKACPKKVAEMFYMSHSKALKALMEPFLAEAKSGRVIPRSADAFVTACLTDSTDNLIYWHAVNNRRMCRVPDGTAKRAS